MKREPTKLNPCIKAKMYKEKPDGTVLITGMLEKVEDKKSQQYGDCIISTIKTTEKQMKELTFENEVTPEEYKEELVSVFLNNYSLTVMCEAHGNDDEGWLHKPIKVTKETDKNFNTPMFVLHPNEETVK